MIIQEQHYDFKIKSDKVDSLKNRNFLPAEIDWMLNTATQEFVDNKYNDFETKQDLTDQLSTLVIKCPTPIQPPVPVTLTSTGVWEMSTGDLVFPYLHLIRLNGRVIKDNCGFKTIRGNEVSHDTLDKVLISPFEGPDFEWLRLPYVFGKGTRGGLFGNYPSIFFYTNNLFTLNEVYPEYLRIPKQVFFGGYNSLDGQYSSTDPQVNSDLPVAFHRRIVDIAVANAASYIDNPDYMQKLQKTFIQ